MFDRNLLKIEGMKGVLGALFVFALLQAAAIAGLTWALATAIAELWSGAPLSDQVPNIVAFFCCFALRRIIVFAQDTMLDRFSQSRAQVLRQQVLEAALARSENIRSLGTATIATTAAQGIDDVQKYLRVIPPKAIGVVAVSIPLLIVTFAADWPSGIILTVMFPVIVLFMVLLGRQARDRAAKQYSVYNRLSNHFLDTLRGIDAVVAAGAVERTDREVFTQSEKLRKATVRLLTTSTLSSAVLDLCATFGVAAVAIMLAFRLMDGSITLTTGIIALMLAPEFFLPIRAFASDFHASLDGKNALAAVLNLTENRDQSALHRQGEPTSLPSEIALRIRDVSYFYPESDQPAIDQLSLEISRGEHVGLIGESGSGKTTLASLAAGFLCPSSGTIEAALPVHFIPQNPYIFRASLRDNIAFYCPDAPDEAIERAVEAVGLNAFVSELPQGLQTPIGEGTRGLSGGQAHRIALARALLDSSDRILIFDEPTAHLDIETEIELKERMLPLFEGRTVLFATHRLHWVEDMDRVVTLSDGRLVEPSEGGDPS